MKICNTCLGKGSTFILYRCENCNGIGLVDDNGQTFKQDNPIAIAYKLGYETGYNEAKDIADENERYRDETDY